jgi:hypothetical protein
MFVTTRITNTSQDLKDGCSLTYPTLLSLSLSLFSSPLWCTPSHRRADRNNTCKYVPVSPPNDIYIADIEDFTVRGCSPL